MYKILLFTPIFFLLSFAAASIFFWTLKNGISPMPTSRKAKQAIFTLLDHIVPSGQGKILELGSGWGTLAFPLAKTHPSKPIYGIENSLIPYFFSRFRQYFQKEPNLIFIREDFFNYPIEKGDIIVCYLYPAAMAKLKIKWEREVTSPMWIISNTFAIPGWVPEKTIFIDDLYKTKIYLYRYCPMT